jgi:hypothetical protein
MNLKSFVATLAQKLNWHPERCITFSSLVLGLIHQGNVQHHSLSLGFTGSSRASVKVARISTYR